MLTIGQLPFWVAACLLFLGTGLGYLEGKDRWLNAGAVGHVVLTSLTVACFGFAAFTSMCFLVWTAGLLFGGIMLGYLDSRPRWLAFGLSGAVPLATVAAWGYGA